MLKNIQPSTDEFATSREVLHPYQANRPPPLITDDEWDEPPELLSPTIQAPIDRVPTEMLTMIFKYIRRQALLPDPSQYGYMDMELFSSYRPLVNLALVCRRWSEIVFKCPSLWTEIEGSRPEAPRVFVLSRAAPISLRFDYAPDARELFQRIVLHSGHRMRRLDLVAGQDKILQEASGLVDVAMPILRSLRLSAGCCREKLTVHSTMSCPKLGSLIVQGLMWIPSHPLPRLTHLHLSHVYGAAVELLGLLDHTPALEVMELRYTSTTIEHKSPAPTPHLVRLHTLIVSGAQANVIQFLLSHSETPNLAVITLLQVYDVTRTESLLPSRWKPVRPMTHLALCPSPSHPRTIHVEFNDGQGCELTVRWEFTPALIGMLGALRFPSSLLAMFPYTASIQHLRIPTMEKGALRSLAPHLPSLRTLVIAHADIKWFGIPAFEKQIDMRTLAAYSAQMLEEISDILGAEDPVLFPKLVSLRPYTYVDWTSVAGAFGRTLAKRERAGRGITNVWIMAYDSPTSRDKWKMDFQAILDSEILDHIDELGLVRSGGDSEWSYNGKWKEPHGHWKMETRA